MPNIVFTPKHPGQRRVMEVWNESQALVITGGAGVGKTAVALAMALMRSKKVMLCRPAVPLDEDLGHLPGTMDEKLAPWLAPFADVLGDISEARHLHKWRDIEAVSIGLLGGRTVKNAVLIIDEAQNANFNQLRMALTRVGENGKVVLCGDYDQAVVSGKNPLKDIAQRLTMVEGASVIHFPPEYQLRSKFVQRVLEVL